MTTVKLYGVLEVFAGRSLWSFEVNSVAEALRALDANVQGFLAFLSTHENGQQVYRVTVNDEAPSDLAELSLLRRNLREIVLEPETGGAGKGGAIAMLVVGAILTVVGIGVPMVIGQAAVSAAGSVALALATTVGMALVSAGLSSLMAPSNKQSGQEEKPENRPSYLFSGTVNTLRQGGPVPLGYGEMLVGSQVISASLLATDTFLVALWDRHTDYYAGYEVSYAGNSWRAVINVPRGTVPSEDSSTYWLRL